MNVSLENHPILLRNTQKGNDDLADPNHYEQEQRGAELVFLLRLQNREYGAEKQKEQADDRVQEAQVLENDLKEGSVLFNPAPDPLFLGLLQTQIHHLLNVLHVVLLDTDLPVTAAPQPGHYLSVHFGHLPLRFSVALVPFK